MHFTTISKAAVLIFAVSVQAQWAVVRNECSFPVYMWSVGGSQSPMQTIQPWGTQYQEAYQLVDGGNAGVSIKISKESGNLNTITQFEYTLNGDTVWYDISNINGWPFQNDGGIKLIPSISTCEARTCANGGICSQAYNQPDDNQVVRACSASGSLTLTTCPQAGVAKRDNETLSERETHPEADPESAMPPAGALSRRVPRGQLGSNTV
ncbi:hypothetical protein MMC13_004956 [Lambiella insularis]|nr:hypothetical protein [Lambiella insularis]